MVSHQENKNLKLPPAIITKTDLNRAIRELDAIADFTEQAKIRQSGTRVTLPKLSKSVEELAKINDSNLLEKSSVANLKEALRAVAANAPVVHISFAAEPSASFLNIISTWMRQELHPDLLLEVGLQPSIGAGCVVRTPSKYFDLSLRQHLQKTQPKLSELVRPS